MTMFFLIHSNDVVNTVTAVNENAAWKYFAAVKQLAVIDLQKLGYIITKQRPA